MKASCQCLPGCLQCKHESPSHGRTNSTLNFVFVCFLNLIRPACLPDMLLCPHQDPTSSPLSTYSQYPEGHSTLSWWGGKKEVNYWACWLLAAETDPAKFDAMNTKRKRSCYSLISDSINTNTNSSYFVSCIADVLLISPCIILSTLLGRRYHHCTSLRK